MRRWLGRPVIRLARLSYFGVCCQPSDRRFQQEVSMKCCYTTLTACALLVAAAAPAGAQTTFAAITGTITDATGAAVASAQVVAVHHGSNYRYTALSNAAGAYTLAQLREGVYTVRVQA